MDLNPNRIVPAKQAFSLLDEFKKFAFMGNPIDMADGSGEPSHAKTHKLGA